MQMSLHDDCGWAPSAAGAGRRPSFHWLIKRVRAVRVGQACGHSLWWGSQRHHTILAVLYKLAQPRGALLALLGSCGREQCRA
jgi:hypothetical protein